MDYTGNIDYSPITDKDGNVSLRAPQPMDMLFIQSCSKKIVVNI